MNYYAWKEKYIKDILDTITFTSESVGYAMLLAVYNDDHSLFKDLVEFYKTHLNKRGLMRSSKDSESNFTDADTDIVYALFLAYEKWTDLYFKKIAIKGLIK